MKISSDLCCFFSKLYCGLIPNHPSPPCCSLIRNHSLLYDVLLPTTPSSLPFVVVSFPTTPSSPLLFSYSQPVFTLCCLIPNHSLIRSPCCCLIPNHPLFPPLVVVLFLTILYSMPSHSQPHSPTALKGKI